MKSLYIHNVHMGDAYDFDTTGLPQVLTGIDEYGDQCSPTLKGMGMGVVWEIRDQEDNVIQSGVTAT